MYDGRDNDHLSFKHYLVKVENKTGAEEVVGGENEGGSDYSLPTHFKMKWSLIFLFNLTRRQQKITK